MDLSQSGLVLLKTTVMMVQGLVHVLTLSWNPNRLTNLNAKFVQSQVLRALST